MAETYPDYSDDPRDSSAIERREIFQAWACRRALAISLGDNFRDLARAWVRLDLRHSPRALALIVKAQDRYLDAGLRRQAEALTRYARLVHRAAVAVPRFTGRPPTERMIELALAVKSLTRRNGRPPSTRELAKELGLSRGRVRDLARAARDRGVVTFTDGVPRSIAVPRPRPGQEGRP